MRIPFALRLNLNSPGLAPVAAIVVLLLGVDSAWAGSGAVISFGLRGEYISDEQDVADETTSRSTDLISLTAGVDGHLLDPRFLTYQAYVEQLFRNIDRGELETKNDEFYYSAAIQAFNNRLVSLGLSSGRRNVGFSGFTGGALSSGVQQVDEARVTIRRQGKPSWLELTGRRDDFTADDPNSLRDRALAEARLEGGARWGPVQSQLQMRYRENELFNSGLQTEFGFGRLLVDVRPQSRDQWTTVVSANTYKAARAGEVFAPPTDVFLTTNTFRHLFGSTGFWAASANYQSSKTGDADFTTGEFFGRTVFPVSEPLSIEGEIGFLRSAFSEAADVEQPRAALGIRWGKKVGTWDLFLNPRLSWVSVTTSEGLDESSFGALFAGTVTRRYKNGSLSVEGSYFDNQLSLAPLDDGGGGISFLSGLEKERIRLRFLGDVQASRWLKSDWEVRATRRVRLNQGREIEENLAFGRVGVHWRKITLRGTFDRIEVTGGDLPSDTNRFRADLRWSATAALLFDLVALTDDREVAGLTVDFESLEVGGRFQYGLLTFFARIREDRFDDRVSGNRKFRRFWAGLRRTFAWGMGEVLR